MTDERKAMAERWSTDGPERIYLQPVEECHDDRTWCVDAQFMPDDVITGDESDTPYVRADIHEKAEARVRELETAGRSVVWYWRNDEGFEPSKKQKYAIKLLARSLGILDDGG